MKTKEKKPSFWERYALSELTRNSGDQQGDELFLLSEREISELRKIRFKTLSLAALAGSLGVVFLYVPYHVWGEDLFPVHFISLPFLSEPLALEIEFLLYSVVLVVIEILYLTRLNIVAVSAIARTCGCPNPSDPNYNHIIYALTAVSLEKKQQELKSLGINPYEGLSKWSVFVYQIFLKLKAALSGFLMKLLVTKILGRYALRILVDLAGIPIYAFWNAWGAHRVMNEARVRVMAPPLINKFANELVSEFGSNEAFRSVVYDTLQAVSTRKRSFHYNHFLLAVNVFEKFGISPESEPGFDVDFLDKVPDMDKEVARGIAKLLLFGIMIDGRLSVREKRALKQLRISGVLPYSEDQVARWTRGYFEGRGLEEFFQQ